MMKTFTAAALSAVMILSGCSGSKEIKRPESFTLTSSTEAGNSGEVTLAKGDTYAVISVRDFGDIKIKLFPDLAPYAVYNFTELAKRGDYNGRNFHRLVEHFMIQGGSGNGIGYGGDSFDGGEFKNEINTSLRHYYGALCYAATSMGDITDGFYIVNERDPQTDLAACYDRVSANYTYNASGYGSYLETMDKSDPNYSLVSSIVDYNTSAAKGVIAMKDTITDAVTNTYAEKGGTPSLDGGYTVFGQTVEGFEVIDAISIVDKEDDGNGNISKPVQDIIIDKIEIFTME